MAPPKDFDPPKRILSEYIGQVEALIGKLTGYANQPANLISLSIQPAFREAAQNIAQNMAARMLKSNARSWRSAARKASNGRMIYEELRRELQEPVGRAVAKIIQENAWLISSLPLTLAEETTKYIGKRQMQGVRSEQITQELRVKLPHLAKSRIHLIARTEVAKSETAITQARAESLGLGWFEWISSHDSRVRPSHKNLDGVLVAWNDLPNPDALIGQPSSLGRGAAGQFPNCRCVSLPLVDLNEVRFPKRVYSGGRISRMSKAQFMRVAGMKKAA